MAETPFPPEVMARVRQAVVEARFDYEDEPSEAACRVIADYLRSEEARERDALDARGERYIPKA